MDRIEEDAGQVENALDPHVAVKHEGKWYRVRARDYQVYMPHLIHMVDIVVAPDGKVHKNRHGPVGEIMRRFIDDCDNETDGDGTVRWRKIWELPIMEVTTIGSPACKC